MLTGVLWYNKVDELAAFVTRDRSFRKDDLRDSSQGLGSLTRSPHHNAQTDGFSLVRDPVKSGKETGGGVCLYVNGQWCHPGHEE